MKTYKKNNITCIFTILKQKEDFFNDIKTVLSKVNSYVVVLLFLNSFKKTKMFLNILFTILKESF